GAWTTWRRKSPRASNPDGGSRYARRSTTSVRRHNNTARSGQEQTMPPAPADRRAGARSAGGAASAQRAQLLDLLTPLVSAAGYDLEDVTVTSAGRRSLVRVIVDADDGVDLDGVAEVSRTVSDALDGDDAFAGP